MQCPTLPPSSHKTAVTTTANQRTATRRLQCKGDNSCDQAQAKGKETNKSKHAARSHCHSKQSSSPHTSGVQGSP